MDLLELERWINQDRENFEADRKGIDNHYIKYRELINNKSTSVLELERIRASLKKLVVDIKMTYNRLYVYKTDKLQYEYEPEFNEKHKQLLEQAIEQLTLLSESAKEAMKFRKLKGKFDRNNSLQTPTHREILIAHEYKCKARLANNLSRQDMLKEGGPKRYQASLTLIPKHVKYREPVEKELKRVISILGEDANYLPAQRMAINDLNQPLKS